MRCEDALERMLEGDPAELTGRARSPLTGHLRACPRCRALAYALDLELATLNGELTEFAAGGDAGAVAAAALAVSHDSEVAGRKASPSGARHAPGWARRAAVPVAAVAMLAVLLLPRDAAPPPTPAEQPVMATAPRVAVEPPADRAAAVMATANPRITIVWLYEREGS